MISFTATACAVASFLPHLAFGRSFQNPIHQQQQLNFIDTSIFALRPDLLQAAAEPELHAYDEFQDDIPYEGIAYFAHLNGSNCFSASSDGTFDIGIVGAPFDLGVTYRPGARFGPAGTRMGSRRLSPSMAYRFVVSLAPNLRRRR
jgi:agmatinase